MKDISKKYREEIHTVVLSGGVCSARPSVALACLNDSLSAILTVLVNDEYDVVLRNVDICGVKLLIG